MHCHVLHWHALACIALVDVLLIYAFSLVILARRFFIALTPTLSSFGGVFEDAPAQILFMIAVLCSAVALNDYYQPYRYNLLHYVDQFSMLALIVILACAATISHETPGSTTDERLQPLFHINNYYAIIPSRL